MRGNLGKQAESALYIRSIPAHAGQPLLRYLLRRVVGVYPRACGATRSPLFAFLPNTGLSPRMRGNLEVEVRVLVSYRSIPAHAGQPPVHISEPSHIEVYPRACGATPINRFPINKRQGLSPRMRGNLFHTPIQPDIRRSIPAHAGQPFSVKSHSVMQGVYPRACGATSS